MVRLILFNKDHSRINKKDLSLQNVPLEFQSYFYFYNVNSKEVGLRQVPDGNSAQGGAEKSSCWGETSHWLLHHRCILLKVADFPFKKAKFLSQLCFPPPTLQPPQTQLSCKSFHHRLSTPPPQARGQEQPGHRIHSECVKFNNLLPPIRSSPPWGRMTNGDSWHLFITIIHLVWEWHSIKQQNPHSGLKEPAVSSLFISSVFSSSPCSVQSKLASNPLSSKFPVATSSTD